MRRRLFLSSLGAAVVLAAVPSLVPSAVEAAPSPRTGASDLFVFGSDQDLELAPASLHRVSPSGQVLWSRALAGVEGQVSLGMHGADRNITEDSFYLYVSTYDLNLLDGKGQLQRYDGRGNLTWAIGVEGLGADVTVSADPVRGGVFVATSAGITRVDKRGKVLWGPLDFGLGAGVGWAVAVDTSDGSAFVTSYDGDTVMRVSPSGTVVWQTDAVGSPCVPMFSPLDHGVFLGSGEYGRDTVKLSRSGRVEWVREAFPSPYTYGRAVNPVDGSLYLSSGWDARIGHLARDGRVLADVYVNGGWGPIGNQGLATSLDGRFLYTGNSAEALGVDSYRVSTSEMHLQWHVDPEWYAMSDPLDAYTPLYRPFVGMPRVP